jgi:deazaflavin-dependent oxidoreductase (nitroreductase family)
VTGQKFGMMRLTTIGRRSGRTRLAIVGYYEDGPNLVTLAMNGWGKTEPAWWLNLQANPVATVQLVGGPRRVQARVATGDERDRLWSKFTEYPGWGDDRAVRAARRPWQTAVVVLDPQAVTLDAGVAGTGGHPAPIERMSDGQSDAAAPTPTTSRRPRAHARHLWLTSSCGPSN